MRFRAPLHMGLMAVALTLCTGAAAAGEASAGHASFPEHALGNGLRSGKHYFLSRWAEDWWGKMERTPDRFDPLKRIELAGGAARLTLNGQIRLRYNGTHGPGLLDAQRSDQSLLRVHAGANLEVGDHVRVYGELISAHVEGTPASRTTRNDLDWLMLFGEFRGRVGDVDAGIRIGRQDFTDVSPVLFSRRESLNVPLTHNGVRAYVHGARLRFGVFDLEPTTVGMGRFDDEPSSIERIRGVNASIVLDGGRKRFLDPFYYRYENAAKTWGAVRGKDRRDTYGARAWGVAGDWQYDVTAARQDGSFVGRDVSALGVFAKADMAMGRSSMRPRLGVRTDYGSGGGSYGDGRLEAFNYGVGHSPYFADNNYLGPANLVDLAPTFSLQVTPTLRVSGEYALVRRADTDDAVYNGIGQPYAGTESVEGRDVARIARLSGNWAVTPHLSFSTFVNYVDAGAVLRDAGYRDSFYLAVWATYMF